MNLNARQIVGLILLFSGVVLISLYKALDGTLIFLGIILIIVGAFLAVKRDAKPDAGGPMPYDTPADDD